MCVSLTYLEHLDTTYKIRHILIICNKKRWYIFKDKTVSCKMFGNWLPEYNYYVTSYYNLMLISQIG